MQPGSIIWITGSRIWQLQAIGLAKRSLGRLLPLPLHETLMPRAVFDELADFLENPPRFIPLAGTLQQHCVAAARFLAREIENERAVFRQRSSVFPLFFEAAGIKKMRFRRM